jgi:ubiquinone/menaquinone biosynthesis C-methylase UbiE
MSSYIGRHAKLYDLFYADKPYAQEAEFVHSCIQRYGDGCSTRMLELACGTGNHARALAKYDYTITATDYSVDMLQQAQDKTKKIASQVNFQLEDMRSLELPDRSFDVAICLFDSIGYVATNEALLQVLRGIHRCLRPSGLFIFEFWHAAAMLKGYDPLRIRRWTVPGGEVLRISETVLHPAQQLASVTYTIYELKADGSYSSLKETQTNRFFLVQEMAGWLMVSGFTAVNWFAGFTNVESITEDTWHVVAVARSKDTSEVDTHGL